MKKTLAMVALIAGAMCITENSAMASTNVNVQDTRSCSHCNNDKCKGLLATRYVDVNQDRFTITIPAPSETVIGVAPNFQWSYNNMDRTLTITGSLDTLNLHYVGEEKLFEVAVSGGFYHVLLIGR